MPSWCKDLKNNIIGIEMSASPPDWDSSTPLPKDQLAKLASLGFVDGFRDYEIDHDLANLLKNKRAILVCPSPHLKNKKMGKFIDSFDLVIRVNQNFAMPEERWEDYGSRTDILFNCLNELKIDALKQNMEYVKSLKYIVCPMLSMWDVGRVEKFLNTTGVPWHNVCDGYLFKIFKEVGTTCNSGLTTIITLLSYQLSELHVTGMTFFNMNTFGNIYYDEYQKEAVKYKNFRLTTDGLAEPYVPDLRMDIHAQEPQIRYFRKILEKYYNNPLTIDEYLKNHFNLTINGILPSLRVLADPQKIESVLEMDKILKYHMGLTITKWDGCFDDSQ